METLAEMPHQGLLVEADTQSGMMGILEEVRISELSSCGKEFWDMN